MALNFRRGAAAMEPPQREQSGGRRFTPFCPEIIWTEDGEEKFIAFLNNLEEIPKVLVHEFVPVGEGISRAGRTYTKYEKFLDRTDPAIGEDSDDLTERLDHAPRARHMAAAIELEPTYKTVNGRKRPTGFAVKTETYTRNTEDGEEEVTIPVIGIITQARGNFFGWLKSFNDSTAPIEETPFQVHRRGKGADTQYDFTPFIDQEIDYTNLINLVGGVGYLSEETEKMPGGSDLETALYIGTVFLEKRLNELADGDRYESLVGPITYIENRFAKADKQEKSSPKVTRPVTPAGPDQEKFAKLRAKFENN